MQTSAETSADEDQVMKSRLASPEPASNPNNDDLSDGGGDARMRGVSEVGSRSPRVDRRARELTSIALTLGVPERAGTRHGSTRDVILVRRPERLQRDGPTQPVSPRTGRVCPLADRIGLGRSRRNPRRSGTAAAVQRRRFDFKRRLSSDESFERNVELELFDSRDGTRRADRERDQCRNRFGRFALARVVA